MKLRDTKLGGWLRDNVPKILDAAGDLLPDKGVFGIVKNLISNDNDIPNEKKMEFINKQNEFELDLLKIETAERKDARLREIEFVKATGGIDRFMTVIGAFIILAFAFCMYVTVYIELPDTSREMFIEVRATTRDLLIGLGTYYWGSSAGSRIKDMKSRL